MAAPSESTPHACRPWVDGRSCQTDDVREEQNRTFNVAGQKYDVQGAFVRLINYPSKTPVAFDFPGSGDADRLTADEVKRTRAVKSRISNLELDFFVERGATAPWVSP